MNAIIQFENHPFAARHVRDTFLLPPLRRAEVPVTPLYINYIDKTVAGAPALSPNDVAAKAVSDCDRYVPMAERSVWILDLDPDNTVTADSSYGLCVLQALAEKQFAITPLAFLAKASFLTVILTLYPANLLQNNGVRLLENPRCDLRSIDLAWPSVPKIQNSVPNTRSEEAVVKAVIEAKKEGPRIIFAKSGTDEWWLGEVIKGWLV